ncbi:hypothetical protein L210DRAFT_3641116 [Boletus edulis BED1]|uniref:Uncharacterized protein n=1 Tax=Boletus edulis BED1 TaxID=1328754 RepID=A0AAD4C649_BOLED|nr:hypothetical protein L210DRAFT_3641116 [Boletus edulis BED1]
MNPEERVLAARCYRADHYAKNRVEINWQRAENRRASRATKKCQPVAPMGQPSAKNPMLIRCPGRPKGTKNHSCSGTHEPTNTVSDIQTALKSIIGNSSRQRVQALSERFLASRDYKDIYDTLSAVEEVEARFCKLAMDSHHQAFSTLQHAIRTVIRVLEDLLMSAMEDADMSDLTKRGLMLYQNGPDITL